MSRCCPIRYTLGNSLLGRRIWPNFGLFDYNTNTRRAPYYYYCSQGQITPFYLMKSDGKQKGRRWFHLEHECFDGYGFYKNLYWCWKLEKTFIQDSYVLTRTTVLFLDLVERDSWHIYLVLFLFLCLLPFLKKKKSNTQQKENGNVIIKCCEKNWNPNCWAVCTWLTTCVGASSVPSDKPLLLQGRTSKC